MGKLERDYSLFNLRSIRNRLETLAHDPRYRFMFGKGFVEDNLGQIVGRIFRIPDEGRRVCVVQLGGLPNEVVNAVVSVLARLAFDIAVHAGPGYEISLICEEAHRYIPADQSLGFGPTRRAIGRIAKEGRKYGASLGVVSQRPSELDRTVLSQCSTMFAMRLLSDMDKAVIRSALAESSGSIIGFISSLGDGEAIAFGEGVATPMRMRFRRPTRTDLASASVEAQAQPPAPDLSRVVRQLRGTAPADTGTAPQTPVPEPKDASVRW
jgi:DNA helicase HerA-like ATPase